MATVTDQLFNIEHYRITTHMAERCLERFGIKPEDTRAFVQSHSPVHNLNLHQPGNRVQTRAKDGTIFIINPIEQTILTVYPAVDAAISMAPKHSFADAIENIVNLHKNMVTRAFMRDISDALDDFNKVSLEFRHDFADHLEPGHIDRLYKNTSIIKTTLNILSKELNYYDSFVERLERPEPIEPSNYAEMVPSVAETYDAVKETNVLKGPSVSDVYNDMNDRVYCEPQAHDLLYAEEPRAMYAEVEEPSLAPASMGLSLEPLAPSFTPGKPTVAVKELPSDYVLKDVITSEQRIEINNFITKKCNSSQLASTVIKRIKNGDKRSQLLQAVKPQLKVVDYNAFKDMLNRYARAHFC